MNVSRLCDAASAAALRFDWLDEQLLPAGEYGRVAFRELTPFTAGNESDARRQAEHIGSIAAQSDPEDLESIREALRELPDVRATVARARLAEILNDTDFFMLLRFCDITVRLAKLVNTLPDEPMTACSQVLEILAPGKSGDFGFYLADRFDEALTRRRRELQDAQTGFDRLREEQADSIARSLERGQIATDEFIVMRDEVRGRLPAGVRVIREAPTYFLCELELSERALEALQARDRCAAAAAAAEEAVRAKLSALIAECADSLEQSAADSGRIDMTVAAARFAQRYGCHAATYLAAPHLEFSGARFLPLEHELSLRDRRYVPIDLALEQSNVLTGANMSGKSAALRTAGFIALCAGFGLPVPAERASVGLFTRICWLGVGAENTEEQLLSSFAREVVRLREIMEWEDPALWLIDEFARTTAPDEARALLLALLRRLRAGNNCALAATHLIDLGVETSIAQFAVGGLRGDGAPPLADTDDALRALADRMDYRIRRGQQAPKSPSDAIELAGWLGLDKDLVKSAKEILAQCSR